jgi:hypothetical protein
MYGSRSLLVQTQIEIASSSNTDRADVERDKGNFVTMQIQVLTGGEYEAARNGNILAEDGRAAHCCVSVRATEHL